MAGTENTGERARPAYAEQLKVLKERRGKNVQAAEKLKEQARIQQAVLKAIADEARTVPEIAEVTGLPAEQVFWWITALRKYNKVQDEKKRGDYMSYRKREGVR